MITMLSGRVRAGVAAAAARIRAAVTSVSRRAADPPPPAGLGPDRHRQLSGQQHEKAGQVGHPRQEESADPGRLDHGDACRVPQRRWCHSYTALVRAAVAT